jgi:hypothetical protein
MPLLTSSTHNLSKQHERTTKVFAKAGQTEAVFQQFQHQWSVVRAVQATFG